MDFGHLAFSELNCSIPVVSITTGGAVFPVLNPTGIPEFIERWSHHRLDFGCRHPHTKLPPFVFAEALRILRVLAQCKRKKPLAQWGPQLGQPSDDSETEAKEGHKYHHPARCKSKAISSHIGDCSPIRRARATRATASFGCRGWERTVWRKWILRLSDSGRVWIHPPGGNPGKTVLINRAP
jgi:hypothetical protein